jgi:hypothetical protein
MNFVGEIIEREFEEDDEIEMVEVRFPMGFPISEKVYDTIVVEPIISEKQKLEWTFDPGLSSAGDTELNANTKDTAYEMRFDFQGRIATQTNDSALYHHGKDPTKPGYTLSELIHLSKSTVPGQRVIAFDTLSKILSRVIELEYDVYEELERSEVWIVARVGVDATHETVLKSALKLIATGLGYPISFIDTFALKNGLRTISMESLDAFRSRAIGNAVDVDEQELGDTIQKVSETLKRDVILGLVMTNLVPRLRFILQNDTLDIESQIQILYILTRIAQHSASSAEDILSCEGLVALIMSRMVKVSWPTDQQQELVFIESSLRMFTFIAQTSREACDALVKFGVVREAIRFITCLPQNNDVFKLNVAKNAYCLLSVTFAYGFEGWLIDSYRTVLLDSFQQSILHLHENDQVLGMICKTLTMALTSFERELDAGGIDDAFYPFVEQIVPILEQKVI